MTSGTRGGYLHAAFGLRVRSALALPELPSLAEDGGPEDVVIEQGPVAERLEGAVDVDPAMQVTARAFQLAVPLGRFAVSEGRRIIVDPRPDASDADLRPFLLGTAMGALCHQRALLPLHAAAISLAGGAVAFAGPSGAGKSTLAAHFLGRGRGVLADDILAVDAGGHGGPLALPGLARIRLRAERAAASEPKASLPISGHAALGAWPLRRIYRLRPEGADPPKVCRLRGAEAVGALLGQVYRWPIAAAMGRGPALFDQCLILARRCEVFEVSFAHADAPLALAEVLEAHLVA
ncbi:MAG TPA: hypothetical protein VKQ54_15895 [Caulobacteraceae bacterium]|nr:hypothetical protein [Caulobacteraceae bacterium]